ncbi:MAG: acyltransferase family protein [Lachnospiraceae bacterium]|nr:acyltransferase family protein [Lachnospiraceae bacterium]
MKILIKRRKSILFSLLLLMVMGIYITIGSKGEEKSKFGDTVQDKNGALTYIREIDLNVSTPKTYLRFFPDTTTRVVATEMKRLSMDFLALSQDYCDLWEFYILPSASAPGRDFCEQQILASTNEYELTSTPAYEQLSLGELTFMRTCYSRKNIAFGDNSVVADYFTFLDNCILEIRCYHEESAELPYDQTLADLLKNCESSLARYSRGPAKGGSDDGPYLWARWKGLTFAPWLLLIPFVFILLDGAAWMGRSERLYDSEQKRYYYVGEGCSGWNEDFLSLSSSKLILGFMAVLIVFHHMVQQSDPMDVGMLGFLENAGVGFVGMYFFFSGYGLHESLKAKKDYLSGFLKKRLPPILIPFYVCILVFVACELLTNGPVKAGRLIGWLSGWDLINSHMWYIVEITILYLLFLLSFRLIKNRKLALFLLFCSTAAMVAGSLLLGHGDAWFQGEWWYNTTLLFPFGIWFSMHREKLVDFMKHYYVVLLPLTAVLFILFQKATEYMLMTYSYWSETLMDKGYDDKLRCLSVQLPMVLFFVLLMLLAGMKLKIGNAALRFLGDISLELYLIHNLFMGAFSSIKGTGAFFVSVLITAIPAAALLHFLDSCLLCLIRKKPLPDLRAGFRTLVESTKRRHEESLAAAALRHRNLREAMRNRKRFVRLIFRQLVCTLITLITVFPICLLVINATKNPQELKQILSFLPGGHFAENYMSVKATLADYGLNVYTLVGRSTAISASCAVFATYLGAMCAYGFEHYSFKGKNAFWWMVIVSMMIPSIAGAVGFLKLVDTFHIYNSIVPIILVSITVPSCVYFFRMYLHTLRLQEVIEAARIDGCNEILSFFRIILPIMKPAVYLELIINFSLSWNNTVYQNLVLIDVKKKTIATFMNLLAGWSGSGGSPWIYCLLLVSTIPSLVVYILFSEGIMANINIGSVKE